MDPKIQTALVVGGSRGLGRAIALELQRAGVKTTVLARPSLELEQLHQQHDLQVLAGDAVEPGFLAKALDAINPAVVVLTAGAIPLMRPLAQYDWEAFSAPWQMDVKATFYLLRDLLIRPLSLPTRVVVFSSGAARQGSPLSGGYASAKQAQRFLCRYARGEAEARTLELNVQCVMPSLNPNTRLGATGIRGYARRAGLSEEEFVRKNFANALTPEIAGRAVVSLLTDESFENHGEFTLDGQGLHLVDS